MRKSTRVFIVSSIVIGLFASKPAFGQTESGASEVEAVKPEVGRLWDRVNTLAWARQPVATPAAAQSQQTAAPPLGERGIFLAAAPSGEREIPLEKGTLLEAAGLPKLEVAGIRITGFGIASFNYNSHLQLVPEFAGATRALADPGSTNFRLDKVGIGLFRTFAPWLSASALIEIENARTRHSHGFDSTVPSGFGCPGTTTCTERFGSEEAETEVAFEKFNLTAIAPVGNGLSLSIGRFDVPFGIEREDEVLLLTATTSELFQFGRPSLMTGFQTSYQFNPWVDVTAWVVNRWESETTEDPSDDNNRDKSFGGRIGLTPFPRGQLLNVGVGGFWGPAQDDNNHDKRWIVDVDVTWAPISGLVVAGEALYGGEDHVSFRERGIPFPASEVVNENVNWWGAYLLAHYDVRDWLGATVRYGYFNDQDGARTGVEQILHSLTFTPVLHLSRLIPDLRPTGAAYARTRHPVEWVDLKFEYRVNFSTRPVFSDEAPGVDILEADHTSHQVQVQAVVNF